jgi:hypothetical protein
MSNSFSQPTLSLTVGAWQAIENNFAKHVSFLKGIWIDPRGGAIL